MWQVLQGVVVALGPASEGFLQGGRLWGGASFLESYLCSHPVPALRPVCLCFACLKWLGVDPGMWLGSPECG